MHWRVLAGALPPCTTLLDPAFVKKMTMAEQVRGGCIINTLHPLGCPQHGQKVEI